MFDSNVWTPALQGSISQTCLECIIQVMAPWFVQAQIRAIYTSALPTLCHWLLPMQPREQPCTHCHATFQVLLWRIVSNFVYIMDCVNASTVTCVSGLPFVLSSRNFVTSMRSTTRQKPLRWNSRPYSECMLSLHIGYMKFLFLKLFIIIFSLGNYPFLWASVPIVDVISKHFKQKQDKVEQQ